MAWRALVPVAAICVLCAGCGGKSGAPPVASTTTVSKPSGGFASATAQFAGMHCGSVGLKAGPLVGGYDLYVCAGPDDATPSLGIPAGDYVCWGFHDFGKGHEQPAVELNLMTADGTTVGGKVFPDTTVNCRRTLRAVAGVL